MDEFAQRILHQASGESVRIKSQALTPALWIAGICSPTGAWILLNGKHWAVQAFGGLILVAGLGTAIVAYFYFATRDPDRLGSEAFVVQKKYLEYVQQQGQPAPVLAPPERGVPKEHLDCKPEVSD